jgi:MoxR-like ATPase
MGKILEQLGIYGIDERVENSIVASLTLGDPALLIGAPGSG